MDAIKAIEARKSVRSYQGRAVEKEKIETLVMAAKNAPKAGNFHITVITNKEILGKINDTTLDAMKKSGNEFLMSRAALDGYMPLYGAPVLIMLSAPPEETFSAVNTACAATNVCIAATALGLGSCYVVSPTLTLGPDKEMCRKIGFPEGYAPFCGVLIGYAGEEKFTTERYSPDNVNFYE